jgi:glycosyltransferase involved in cell wall biosynthesis
MMREPLVSILLPYRNAEKTLPRCLDSIKQQSCKRWELIAVDDNSTDYSKGIIIEYSNLDTRIRSFDSCGRGIVDAMNYGIKLARSKFVVRMDADDCMYPQRLDRLLSFLLNNSQFGLVASKIKYRTDIGSGFYGKGYSRYVDWSNRIITNEQIYHHQFEESPFAHPSVAFKKSTVDKLGGYRKGNFPEDYELWLRWLSHGVRMQKIDEYLLDWYDSADRHSRVCSDYIKESFQKLKAKYLPGWLSNTNYNKKKISAWGTGKIARRQIKHLVNNHILITTFYEVDKKKIGQECNGSPILSIERICPSNNEFILILAGARGAREKILAFLEEKELTLGQDFLFLA